MNSQEVEKFLQKEAASGNDLAKNYLEILKEALPPMKEHWLLYLGMMLEENAGER